MIYGLSDGGHIDPNSLVIMKLRRMKRQEKDKILPKSPSIATQQHKRHFKRRMTTAIEMIEGLDGMNPTPKGGETNASHGEGARKTHTLYDEDEDEDDDQDDNQDKTFFE